MKGEGVVQHVPRFNGVTQGFVASLQRIVAAGDRREAQDRVLETLQAELRPNTLTVSERDEGGVWRLTRCYRDGGVWEEAVGTAVPQFGLTYAAEREGRTVYWDTNRAVPARSEWFLYPYHFGVPVVPPSSERAEEVFVLGFEDEVRFVDESAVIAGIVASAYGSVIARDRGVDRGIQIGRVLEQERMAQRLHDEAVQKVFACQCAVRSLLAGMPGDEGPAAQKLSELLSMLGAVNRDLRRLLVEEDRRVSGASLTFGAVLAEEVERHRRLGGCTVEVAAFSDDLVGDPVAGVLGDVLREALANIRKHAEATLARVSVGADGKRLVLSVCDNGKDFGENGGAGSCGSEGVHFGIAHMRRALERLGGSLTAGNADGGACVRAVLPLGTEAGYGCR